MKNGFIKVSACTPEIRVADCNFNADKIIEMISIANKSEGKLIVFPELCVTGYTCQDLFNQPTLIDGALVALMKILRATKGFDSIVAVGMPIRNNGKLYNSAVVMQDGKILVIIPKTSLPNYNEFYEQRHFESYDGNHNEIDLSHFAQNDSEKENLSQISFTQAVLQCQSIPEFCIGFEICEDLWTPNPVSIDLAVSGATIIANLSASDEVIGKKEYRRQLVSSQSASLVCGYIYSSAGDGESTQDMVFSGHNIISENGATLKESELFKNGIITSEIDVQKLAFERRKMSTYPSTTNGDIFVMSFDMKITDTKLTRKFPQNPFIPLDNAKRKERCELILTMQAQGLKKRVTHTHCQSLVIGISGGLDSCLALLVCVKAMDILKMPRKDILAITMPCFGTTKRTRSNAEILCDILGVSFREINITDSVNQHFKDIGHNPDDLSVVYENAQARERTKILMNVANQTNGLVVGTGDLSELALGWATYNGDHMSMYGVNASIPKTLVRLLVKHYADTCDNTKLLEVLYDIVDTPVSPELLPTTENKEDFTQKTEDIVGPYELHDFILYFGIRWGFSPAKVYRIARLAYSEKYSKETILKWLKTFYRRFFSQQFKRSCLPDGAKIGSVSLSPRGDWRMPSDASAALWLKEIDEIK
ncbi:MAG: NAD(+) synthase [Clostridiales bacterium]|nr:NAD(+) synthase [Clostridiales bacterium]